MYKHIFVYPDSTSKIVETFPGMRPTGEMHDEAILIVGINKDGVTYVVKNKLGHIGRIRPYTLTFSKNQWSRLWQTFNKWFVKNHGLRALNRADKSKIKELVERRLEKL